MHFSQTGSIINSAWILWSPPPVQQAPFQCFCIALTSNRYSRFHMRWTVSVMRDPWHEWIPNGKQWRIQEPMYGSHIKVMETVQRMWNLLYFYTVILLAGLKPKPMIARLLPNCYICMVNSELKNKDLCNQDSSNVKAPHLSCLGKIKWHGEGAWTVI